MSLGDMIAFGIAELTRFFGDPEIAKNILASGLYSLILSVISIVIILKSISYNKISMIRWYYQLITNKTEIPEDEVDISGYYHARYEYKKGRNSNNTSLYGEVIFIYKNKKSQNCIGFVLKRHKMKGGKHAKGEELSSSSAKRFTGYYSIKNKVLCGVWMDPAKPDEVAGTFILQFKEESKDLRQLVGN